MTNYAAGEGIGVYLNVHNYFTQKYDGSFVW